tara:strand:+ start:59 stop:514 length:456 start_codon:yes stop_codon:yes gene_type:complete
MYKGPRIIKLDTQLRLGYYGTMNRKVNMQVKFYDSGTPLKKSKNRHGETCEEQLRRMCKRIADEITDGKISADKWMDGVYDIEWTTHRDHEYRAARLLVAGGGPTIWVNTLTDNVEGYWGTDRVKHGFSDQIGLDEYLLEMHADETAVLTS